MGISAFCRQSPKNRKAADPPGLRMALRTQSRTFVLSSAIFADRALKDEEIVEELFLASLSRRPTAEEVEVAKHVIAENKKTGVENIEWALLNSTEFLVNH